MRLYSVFRYGELNYMSRKEELEMELKELRLKKRELVLANEKTDKIDKEIKEIEIEIEIERMSLNKQ